MTDLSPRRLALGIAALWALAAAIMIAMSWGRLATLSAWDPDDLMRLQQVRDWLGGQSFFDVTQYRLASPDGYAMHWSRIVDAPIAALCLLLGPLLGPVAAERVAITLVPLLTMGGIMAAAAAVTARLADRRSALLAAMLVVVAPLILFQVLPMRIDHHGWQTMMGLAAFAALFDRNAARGGLLVGLSAAVWLAISLEGLPLVAAIGALLGLRFVIDGARHGAALRLRGFAAGFGLLTLFLFATLHGASAWGERPCDAVGPAWFGPFALSPLLLVALLPLATPRGPLLRTALLLIAAGAGVGLLAATAPACLGGPFVTLDPLVRTIWYENVMEGMPVWRQPANNIIILLCFPPIGIAGALIARAQAPDAAARRDWTSALLLMLAAFAVSLLVQRTGALAHGYALVGAAVLLRRMLDAIGRWKLMPARVIVSAVAMILVAPIGTTGIAGMLLDHIKGEAPPSTPTAADRPCTAPCDRFGALARLPAAYMLAPLDIAPSVLVNTHHRLAGSGYHRNTAAIHRVIAAFTGTPEAARRIMAETGMRYVLIDPAEGEPTIYRRVAPDGLMARLLADRPPAWLQPVPLPGSSLKLWRRIDGSPPKPRDSGPVSR
jgi:hypothetical protein